MRCRHAQKLLPAMAAGELAEREAAALREHLSGCPRCAAELKTYQDSLSALKATRDRSMPDGLWDGYWERIRDEAVTPQLERVRRVRLPWQYAIGLAAAAAIVAAVFIGFAALRKAQSPATEKKEQPLVVRGILGRSPAPVLAQEESPRVYVLTDMAGADAERRSIQHLPNLCGGVERDRQYPLKQVKLAEKDESKYDF